METLPDFRLLRPNSINDAVAARGASKEARYLAGGTDLLTNMRRGLVSAQTLIDLGAIDELRRLAVDDGGFTIGAGVTLEKLAAHPMVIAEYAALAEAALSIAGPTHRAVGTVGGNLCLDTRCRFYNQSEPWRAGNDYCMKIAGDTCRVAPKADRCYAAFSGDLAPALMVLGAVAEIAGPAGRRRMPLAEVYADDGIRYLSLAPEELLVSVWLPAANGLRSGYEKLRVRGAVDFPLAGVAVALRFEGGHATDLSVAVTGTDSRPVLITGLGGLTGADDQAAIEKLLRKQVGPMETAITPAPYRRRAVPVLAKRLIARLLAGQPTAKG
ncbi:MAG TPA: 4-hydroxybenzoyl-CoA reductase subunit beta [Rhodocyclaceae bacterium]|nr:4-hydroxybenzoyl-CoA reductase subunit beta [Rhodocyclaceae bacterium]